MKKNRNILTFNQQTRLNIFRSHVLVSFLCLFLLMSLSSCVPSASNSNNKKTTNTSNDIGNSDNSNDIPDQPTFEQQINFFQVGSNTSTTTFFLPIDFDDSFFLRGSQVNSLANSANQTTQCLVFNIPGSLDAKVLIVAAQPRFFTNFQTRVREYYYQHSPDDKNLNSSFCQTAGITSAMSSRYSGSTLAFSLSDVCPSCNSGINLRSSEINLFSSSGAIFGSVELQNLTLSVDLSAQQNNQTFACSISSECQSQGFDCCNQGQCVRDGTVKNGVDQNSSEFKQAEQDIANNNNRNKGDYPHFFNVCTNNSGQGDQEEEPDTTELENDSALRFQDLQDLFNCTNLIKGEMSLCTVRIDDASTKGNTFFTGADDRNFTTTYSGSAGIPAHSIERITYANEPLFENNSFVSNDVTIGINNNLTGNDNFFDTLQIGFTKTKPDSAPNDVLKIRYKIDGSCTPISSKVARCSKFYVQGQNTGDVDDHFPGSNSFKLPFYADLDRSILVFVDDDKQIEGTHWDLNRNDNTIEFKGNNIAVFDTQILEIRFSVDSETFNVLQAKNEALTKIQEICKCPEPTCGLQEVKDNNGDVTDYSCFYPPNQESTPPLQQTVFLSSRTVPVRYFDNTGAEHENLDVAVPDQEGTAFSYTNNDLVRPNNINQYIGFNEIYGTFTSSGTRSPLPPKQVKIVKNTLYDIFVDNGAYSSCAVCGSDYHSNLVRLFPQTFDTNKGGGYRPNATATNKSTVTDIRGDDQIFGRACFVPTTMLPWSHTDDSDLQAQRIRRQNAQHFLFANGYQRDWFGFDYGSVIGSFDGVNWFSVGTQRRILSKSNKLFLAVNGYFGDLGDNTSFKVFIQDASIVAEQGSTPDNDFDSDGAECRSFHQCETDSDCATQLGWEYSCQSVSQLTTNWPSFDSNANEIPSKVDIKRLATLFDTTGTTAKKCVYRGRGTPCNSTTKTDPEENSFNGVGDPGLTSCNPNYYCQDIRDGASNVALFNDRIARFARSPSFQNASSSVVESDLDQFGFGARNIGRPYQYNGDKAANVTVFSNFSNNKVGALCIPGRDPNQPTYEAQDNASIPNRGTGIYEGDQANGQGMVLEPDDVSQTHFNACPIFNSSGDYFAYDEDDFSFDFTNDNNKVTNAAVSQVLSTNHLLVFNNFLNGRNKIFKNFRNEQITSTTLGSNRCLRAPGAVCHTDLDCAPSEFIASKVDSLATNSDVLSALNEFEIKFWQEELVCGQAIAKTSTDYELKNNRCCRPIGETLTIASEVIGQGTKSDSSTIPERLFNTNIPGIDEEFTDATALKQRYSRLNLAKNFLQNNSIANKLTVNNVNRCTNSADPNCRDVSTLSNQFLTLSEIAEKTCCSGHWVRNFDDSNGSGGHLWEATKLQSFEKSGLSCYNEVAATGTRDCDEDIDNPNCPIRNVSTAEARPILEWLSSMELTGIPQVAVDNLNSDIQCSNTPSANPPALPDGFLSASPVAEYNDATDAAKTFLAANDEENFASGLKQVFSDTEFSCCLPVGTSMPENADASQCCSGVINSNTNQCALNDFVNLSVYFNKNVSSEAKSLNQSLFDSRTGKIKSKQRTVELACTLNACASNLVAFGVSLSNVRVVADQEKTRRQFIDDNDGELDDRNGLATLFDEGLRWNEDVYCVPAEIEQIVEDASGDSGGVNNPITIFNCNDF